MGEQFAPWLTLRFGIHFALPLPTSICGCGSGESGCSACGCCKACARELDGQEARQRGIFDAVKEMIPLDLLLGTQTDRPAGRPTSRRPLPRLVPPLFTFHFVPRRYDCAFSYVARSLNGLRLVGPSVTTVVCCNVDQCVSRWRFTSTPLVRCDRAAAESLLGHRASPSFIDVCFVLPCSILLSSPSFFSLLQSVSATCTWGLFFCVFFSCACASPSRSEHRGAHPDPSGGEAPEDQPPTPAGGRQRYAAGPRDPVPGRGLLGGGAPLLAL